MADQNEIPADESGVETPSEGSQTSPENQKAETPEGKEPKQPEVKADNADDKGTSPAKPDTIKPTVRQTSPQDHIIARKDEKIKSLQEKLSQYEDTKEDDAKGGDDTRIKKLENQISAMVEEKDIDKFVQKHPEAEGYEDNLREWAKAHPTMPVEQLFYAMTGSKIAEVAAQNARKAIEKAEGSQTGGFGGREKITSKSGKSIDEMTDEEFQKFSDEAEYAEA